MKLKNRIQNIKYILGIAAFFIIFMANTFKLEASNYQYDWTKCGREDVTSEFLNKVAGICDELDASPDDLMAVMAFESGLSHTRINASSGATGLIQFMPYTATSLGTSTLALRNMSAIEQLDYVKKYFMPYRNRVKTIGDMYMAVLWPAAIGKQDNYALFVRGTAAYSGNSVLDINRDGRVTKSEAVSFVINAREKYTGGTAVMPIPGRPHNPIGCLDLAVGTDGKFTISGWAFDYDQTATALNIHVYVGGPAGSSNIVWSTGDVVANQSRVDVNNAFGNAVGNNHGFSAIFDVPFTGTYPVYVYAINVGEQDNPNCNTRIGESTITVKSAVQTCSMPNISFSDIDGGKKAHIAVNDGETINYQLKKDGVTIGSGNVSETYEYTISEEGTYEISAYAAKSGCNNSGIAVKSTTVSKVAIPNIIQSVTGTGIVLNMQTETEGATIYYTTSGNTPTISSTRYSGVVMLDSEKTIKAIAAKAGYINSDISETTIKLSVPPAPTGFKLTSDNKVPVGENVVVSWDIEKEAASYTVALYKDNKEITSTTTNGTSATLNLPIAGKYQIKIYASNFVGNSVVAENVAEVEAMAPLTVRFEDWDGSLIKTQEVAYGKDVVLPDDPYRKGYTFISWKNGNKITGIKEDVTITAEYKINTYTVRFFDASMNQVGATQKVDYGQAAVSPQDKLTDIPVGYVFSGWKVIECANDSQCNYLEVDSDMKLQAVYYWENESLPIVNEITSATWDAETGNYKIKVKLTNYPTDITTALLRVSLYTSQGKMVKSAKAEFDVQADGISEKEITLKYQGTATVAKVCTLGINGNDLTGSALSKETYSKIQCISGKVWSNWSDWSTTEEKEEEGKEIETITQYRYADKVMTTSSASEMSGWTLYNKVQNWSDWGGWSDWSENAQSGSDAKQVETRTVYRYYCFYCPVCGGREPYQGISDCHQYTLTLNNGQIIWSTVPYSSCNPQSYSYTNGKKWTTSLGDGQKWNFSTGNLNDHAVGTKDTDSGAVVIMNQYRYRTRNQNTTYYYYKWNTWSNWSETEVTASDNRKVETRTIYRSRKEEDVYDDVTGTEEQGTPFTISGKLKFEDPDLSGKVATVMVYKGKNADPNEDQIQYISQTTIGEGNTYSFTIIAKADPTILSGDYTVCLGIEGATGLINVDMIAAPKAQYTVKYVDEDGTEISTQTVEEGENAVVPDSPKKDGKYFIGWSENANNVSENMTIVAMYAQIQYVVAFVDSRNNTLTCDTYNYGDEIIVPDAPLCEGYVFKGWDKILEGTTHVYDNMVINAVYDIKKFTVTFVNETGKSISEQNVEYGGCAIPPAALDVSGKEFKGWSTEKNWWNVTEDVTVEPILVYAETTLAPSYRIVELENAIAVFLESDTKNADIYYVHGDGIPTTEDEKYENAPVIIPYSQMEAEESEADTTYELRLSAQLNAYAVSEGKNDSDVQTILYEAERSYSKEVSIVVMFDVNGGSALSSDQMSVSVKEGEAVGELPFPVREGYSFDGWYTKPSGGNLVTAESVLNSDCTLYAHWTEMVDENTPIITIGSKKVLAGKEIAVEVSVSGNTGIAGYSYDINYDNSVMTLKSVSAGNLLKNSGQISTNANVVNWYTADNVTGDGTLMQLVFSVNTDAKAGTYPVSISMHDGKQNLVDENGIYVKANYVAGSIEVTAGTMGDFNEDGDITIADIVLLNRHVLGKALLSSAQLQYADISGDGDITIADVVLLNRHVLGKINLFDIAENALDWEQNMRRSVATMAAPAKIYAANMDMEAGTTVDIPVYMMGNTGMAGFALTVELPEGYTLNSIKSGDILKNGIFTADGKNCTWYASDNISANGVLMKLNVTADQNAKSSKIIISAKDGKPNNISDEMGKTVEVTFGEGNITIHASSDTKCDGKHKGGTATCISKAVCEVCGESYGELNPMNHTGNTEVRDAKAATATEAGYTGDTYCKDCGVKLQSGTVITATGSVKIMIEDATARIGEQIEVPVRITNNHGIAGIALTVHLPEGVHLTEMVKGELLSSGVFSTNEDSCTWYGAENLVGDGTLMILKLTVGTNAVNGVISVETKDGKENNIADETGKTVPVSFKGGAFKIDTRTECEINGHKGGTATCTKQAICEVCGQEYGEMNLQNHVGQTETRNQKNATCTENGYTGDVYCVACGQEVTKGSVIPQTGHGATEVRNAKQATKQEDGYTGDTYCTVCGSQIATGTVIAKIVPPEPTATPGKVMKNTAVNGVFKVLGDGKTVEFTKVLSTKKATVKIPNTITIDGVSCKVVKIAANAFKNNKKLTTIAIGSNVQVIGNNAFLNCKKLKKVKGMTGVTEIGSQAFKGCTALTGITIPQNVQSIGKMAFASCKKLKNITVKTSMLSNGSVGAKAFSGTYAKATVKVPASQLNAYKKLLKSKGMSRKAKYKK